MTGVPWDALSAAGRRRRLRHTAVEALSRYEIAIDRLALVATDTNTVYRVDGRDGRWMLRIGIAGAIEHPLPQVRAEMRVLEHLAAAGLAVPRPVPARDGSLVQEVVVDGIPGARRCVLLEWLPGRILGERVGPRTAAAYGEMAARLHEELARFEPGPDFDIVSYDSPFPFEEPVVLFDAPRSVLGAARRRLFGETRDRVQALIDRLGAGAPRQVLHGDLHVWNVITDGSRLGAIDFEDLMWGWPVQDIATTLYYKETEPHYASFRDAFRSGYSQVAAWPSDREVATFIAARALVMCNDALLLQDDPAFDLDLAAFFARAERRIRRVLG
jgi:Ser/Thr protein kinase RdoA (MazF antagonist)